MHTCFRNSSRRFPLTLIVLGIVGGSTLLSGARAAAQPNKNQPVTNIAEADADFALQGEYWGEVLDPDWRRRLTGLQVVAVGDGKFQAVWYRGGLPGAGWDRATKYKLTGEREGHSVTLTGEQLRAVVYPESAELFDADGRMLGQLRSIMRISPTLGARPPRGATVLFDGSTLEHFDDKARMTDDGLLISGATTQAPVQDFRLHLEFRTPYMPYRRGQARGNSGVYIQRRYEVQVLDSFGLDGVANECGGLYRQRPPEVNMALPPLSWQTYDIFFTSARFNDAGEKVAGARITVLHNGEPIHSNYEFTNKTGAGRKEGPEPLPIHLQAHGSPVHYRNIWIVPYRGPAVSQPCPPRRLRWCCCRHR
jgi:hypothetical protein